MTLKAITTLAVVMLTAIAGAAKIDPAASLRIKHAAKGTDTKAVSRDDEPDQPPYRPLMLQIADEAVLDSLEQYGVVVYNRRNDILLTSIPRENLLKVVGLEGVINAAMSGRVDQCLDVARPFGKVDQAQTGADGLSMPYNGTGVVVGFSDTGFDPNHIAFRDRVKAIYDYDTQYARRTTALTQSQIEAYTTDNVDQYHATHVGNILAGSYRDNGYYGVATGADIVATTSRLHDVGILAGVEDIIAYARNEGKPAVINLSLSSSLGPHDGTDLLCRYLTACSRDAVICISAGNSGQSNIFATAVVDNSNPQASLSVSTQGSSPLKLYGMTELWSSDSTPFDMCVQLYDTDTKQFVYTSPLLAIDGNSSLLIDAETDPAFAAYMQGSIMLECGVSDLNNRFSAAVMYDTDSEYTAAGAHWRRYTTVLTVYAHENAPTRINVFADGSYSRLGTMPSGRFSISAAGSINDMCTAPGVIAVGNLTSRNITPLLDGGTTDWGLPVANICRYSSYSDTPDIERLPHISAPGAWLVSAMSGPYVKAHPEVQAELAASATVDGIDYYWYAAGGTSMSSPFVAGVVAMWLEADPTLDAQRIKEIAMTTADTNFDDIDNPRWGAGEINAVAGLKKVLEEAGGPTTTLAAPFTIGRDHRIIVDTDLAAKARLCNTAGAQVPMHSPLSPGVYVLSIPGYRPAKVMVP